MNLAKNGTRSDREGIACEYIDGHPKREACAAGGRPQGSKLAALGKGVRGAGKRARRGTDRARAAAEVLGGSRGAPVRVKTF